MVDPKMHEVKQWLTKADHDLRSTRQLLKAEPPLLDTAVYHCQQTAEKALKAFLTFQEIPFRKIHILPVLMEQCMEVDSTFEIFMDHAELLSPYATAFRYPGDFVEPELQDVKEALAAAEQILEAVNLRLFSNKLKY